VAWRLYLEARWASLVPYAAAAGLLADILPITPAAVASSPDAAVNVEAVLQVKVWLVGISPMVWRRVLVPASFTLRELHGVVQVTMGWEGIHLYVSRARAVRYGSWELSASSPDVTLADLRFRKVMSMPNATNRVATM
jgi:hypothetical protein